MALFGSQRDVSIFRRISRELMGNIISTQVTFYKFMTGETITNMYGEAAGEKFYQNPLLINALIDLSDQEHNVDDFGVDLSQNILFAFLKDDLVDARLLPEVGDILMYQERYFEVDNIIKNQLSVGKDPDFPNDINPLNLGLEKFGYDVSVVVNTHQVSTDRVNIKKDRF